MSTNKTKKLQVVGMNGLPKGGEAGQILTKNSSTDGDATWRDNVSNIVCNASGEFITVTDAASGEVGLKVVGKTEQKALTGKNLIPYPYNSGNGNQGNGITVTAYSDGSLDVVGTTTKALNFHLCNEAEDEFAAGTYTLSLNKALPDNYSVCCYDGQNVFGAIRQGSTTFTLDTAKKLRIYIHTPTVGLSIDVRGLTVQLERGTTATSYEPYCGGIPALNPDYPQPIHKVAQGTKVRLVGKNLFNASMIQGYSDDSIHLIATQESFAVTTRITLGQLAEGLEIGRTYTLSAKTTASNRAHLYLNVSGFLWTYGTSHEITASDLESVVYLYADQKGGSATISNLILELGTTATAYEPYVSGGEVILPTDLYEGDVYYPLTGSTIKSNNILSFSGSENWQIYTGGSEPYLYLTISGGYITPETTVCTHLPYNAIASSNTNKGICAIWSATFNECRVLVRDDIAPTVEAWKAYLSQQYTAGTPVTLCYKYSPSVTEQYEPQPDIFTLKGTTNVLQIPTDINGDITMDYVADTKLYIDNKITELQALILEG